jgi:hypothetical protein
VTWPTGGQGDQTQPYTGGFGPQGSPNTPQQQQRYGYPPPQQYQYGGLGLYGSTPEPAKPPRGNKTLVVVLSLAAVLVAGGIATGVAVLNRPPDPVAVPAAPLKPLDARNAGWQVQKSSSTRNVAYEVPKAQWTLKDPEDIQPLGPSNGDHVTGTGTAVYQVGYCSGSPTSVRAATAVTASNDLPDKGAAATAEHWAKLAYANSSGKPIGLSLEAPKQIKVADGKIDATLVVADLTLNVDDPCTPKTAKVYATAVTSSDNKGSVLLVLFADEGVPNAVSDSDAMKIMSSMRPSG